MAACALRINRRHRRFRLRRRRRATPLLYHVPYICMYVCKVYIVYIYINSAHAYCTTSLEKSPSRCLRVLRGGISGWVVVGNKYGFFLTSGFFWIMYTQLHTELVYNFCCGWAATELDSCENWCERFSENRTAWFVRCCCCCGSQPDSKIQTNKNKTRFISIYCVSFSNTLSPSNNNINFGVLTRDSDKWTIRSEFGNLFLLHTYKVFCCCCCESCFLPEQELVLTHSLDNIKHERQTKVKNQVLRMESKCCVYTVCPVSDEIRK